MQLARSVAVVLATVLLCLSSAGCCSHSRECAPSTARGWNDSLGQFRRAGVEALRDLEDGPLYALGEARVGDEVNVLLLSGGGSRGAWGTGVLKAWLDRPTFHLVTGVSTGALQATAAFLGTEEQHEKLQRFYTTVSDEDIFVDKGMRGLIFSNALHKPIGLRNLLDEYIDTATIEAVAAGAREGRVLAVGTVNMDHGGFRSWDLTALCSDETIPLDERERRYEEILLASASPPIVFTPVFIRDENGIDQLHVDGGIREQVFVREHLIPIRAALSAAVARGDAREADTELRAYLIVNGKIGVESTCVQDCTIPLLERTLALLLDEVAIGNLYRHKALLDELGFQFNLSRIPEDYPLDFDSFEFDPERMTALMNAGAQWALDHADDWPDDIPDPVDAMLRSIL